MRRQGTRQRPGIRKPTKDACIRQGHGNLTALNRWRHIQRPRALRHFASRTADLPWSPTLLRSLLEELYVDDMFEALVGPIDRIPIRRYPHAVAVALVLRHSWRPDDLRQFAKQLGLHVRV